MNTKMNEFNSLVVTNKQLDYIARCGKAIAAGQSPAEMDRIVKYVEATSPCPELKALVRFYSRSAKQSYTSESGNGDQSRWNKCIEKMRVLYSKKVNRQKQQQAAVASK